MRVDPQVNIRLPRELMDSLGKSAQAARRSLTAEIAFRLQASFGQPPASPVEAGRQCLRGHGPLEHVPGAWALQGLQADGKATDGRAFVVQVHRCGACGAVELVDGDVQPSTGRP